MRRSRPTFPAVLPTVPSTVPSSLLPARVTRIAPLAAGLLLAALLSGCSTEEVPSPAAAGAAMTSATASAEAASPESVASPETAEPTAAAEPMEPLGPMELSVSHIHGAVRDPGTGALLLATHEGLFRQDGSELRRVGPVIDLMGFAVAPDGTLYASGHPGAGADLPDPVGLITSADAGATWRVASRGGESDFHALTVGPRTVVGFDGLLRTTEDGEQWTSLDLGVPVMAVAASPESGTLLATTQAGLVRSEDDGRSWQTLAPPEAAVLVAWADETTAVVATVTGRLAVSEDAGLTWSLGPRSIGQVATLSAQRGPNGQVEVITVVQDSVLSTTDAGESTEVLVR
jgi:hypothetical protein